MKFVKVDSLKYLPPYDHERVTLGTVLFIVKYYNDDIWVIGNNGRLINLTLGLTLTECKGDNNGK